MLEIAAVLLVAIGIGGTILASRGMLPGQSNGNNAATTGTDYPITPGAEDCTVEPMTMAEVEALVPQEPDNVNPDQMAPNPTSEATPPMTLQHHPASEETTREIEAAFRQWIGCSNARDALRSYALYSEDVIRSGAIQLDEDAFDSAPKNVILDVTYVREFDDGRAGGVLVLAPEEFPAAIYPISVIFEKQGDRWLIDGFPMWWMSAVEDTDVTTVEEGWGTPIIEPTFEPTVVQKPTETP